MAWETQEGINLYVHIPFCASECDYCNIPHIVEYSSEVEKYVPKVARQIRKTPSDLITSVYIGGGTPTLLAPADLSVIMHAIGELTLSDDVTLTIETSPQAATNEKIRILDDLGFNSISLGVQTLEEDVLHHMGRKGSASQSMRAFDNLRRFEHVNVDLIYGLLGQSSESFMRDVEAFCPDADSVTLNRWKTNFPKGQSLLQRLGGVPIPTLEECSRMYADAVDLLVSSDYDPYLLETYSRGNPGPYQRDFFALRDNIFGVGAGATSLLDQSLSTNIQSAVSFDPDNPEIVSLPLVQCQEPFFRLGMLRDGMINKRRLQEFEEDPSVLRVISSLLENGALVERGDTLVINPEDSSAGLQLFYQEVAS
ncbi:MAG: radical SAM protein [Candidatus Woesearchaeota archaeon]|jgi:oxygen-independent coproporphyrinogen-3 oxidase|nr:radical SAM protein [Candidatus Woesearchaeota archaeon]MDP7198153.1 radical SAM protein [Candidatus Woesearchaeota archaeon]MDP7466988.1 radical SAM protein [Candidatus Woesearchaeota archaeon]